MLKAETSLKLLLQGNKRFYNNQANRPNSTVDRLQELLEHQSPHAVIITCSDSRVHPVIIFDQGIGDVFVVREAGHALSDESYGSIEYAINHLDVRLIMVLGHTDCGAVKSTKDTTVEHSENLKSLIDNVASNINQDPNDCVNKAIHYNVVNTVEKLKEKLFVKQENKEHLKIIGANFSFIDGKVSLID